MKLKIQNGKLKGNYVKISISQKGINNVSKYITKQAFKAISGMNWNASGIKKIQKMFDKGEINRYDIVEFLDNFNHKTDKDGNVISETQQGDTSIIVILSFVISMDNTLLLFAIRYSLPR